MPEVSLLHPVLIKRDLDHRFANSQMGTSTELLFVDFANKKVYNVFNNNELVDNQLCVEPFKLSEEELKRVLGVFKFDPEAIKMPIALADLIARKDSKQQYVKEKIEHARENQSRKNFDYGGQQTAEQILQKVKPYPSDSVDQTTELG